MYARWTIDRDKLERYTHNIPGFAPFSFAFRHTVNAVALESDPGTSYGGNPDSDQGPLQNILDSGAPRLSRAGAASYQKYFAYFSPIHLQNHRYKCSGIPCGCQATPPQGNYNIAVCIEAIKRVTKTML
jgi:hypothetical protein